MKRERELGAGKISRVPHILVVDDDPLFRAKIRMAARKRALSVTVCSSLEEVSVLSTSRLFDMAVVDYYLDDLKWHLRGTEVAALLESTPVILVSNTNHALESEGHFPPSVRRFLNKSVGIETILDEAARIAQPRMA
jgi:CheY-like chemotaxis protein